MSHRLHARHRDDVHLLCRERSRREFLRRERDERLQEVTARRVRAVLVETEPTSASSSMCSMMQPEYLCEIPTDLEDWHLMRLPAGVFCQLVVRRGDCIHRDAVGRVLRRFKSCLPANTVLDCVYESSGDEYWAYDLLSWRGHLYHDCSAEFRAYWLQTKLEEEADLVHRISNNECPILRIGAHALPLPYDSFCVDAPGSLLFYYKEGSYCFQLSPLVLLVPAIIPSPDAILKVVTASIPTENMIDNICEIELETLDGCIIRANSTGHQSLRIGDLAHCRIIQPSWSDEGYPMFKRAEVLHVAANELMADSWSKVLFRQRLIGCDISDLVTEICASIIT
jgi:hypothetical protein